MHNLQSVDDKAECNPPFGLSISRYAAERNVLDMSYLV